MHTDQYMNQKHRTSKGICHPDQFLKTFAPGEAIEVLPPNVLASLIDHTLLKPQSSKDEIKALCLEAIEHQFQSVCIHPCWVSAAAALLKNSSTAVCTVIGFPLGANHTHIKVAEALKAIQEGATEIDMVINIGALKSGEINTFKQDIQAVAFQARSSGTLLKVIIETCLLTDGEIQRVCQIVKASGAHFVKTSTGFSTEGATLKGVQLMRETVGEQMGVKASGGIRSLAEMLQMIKAGATRIGTSSGVRIMEEAAQAFIKK